MKMQCHTTSNANGKPFVEPPAKLSDSRGKLLMATVNNKTKELRLFEKTNLCRSQAFFLEASCNISVLFLCCKV